VESDGRVLSDASIVRKLSLPWLRIVLFIMVLAMRYLGPYILMSG
jgi:hypothetical protein